MDTAYLPSDLLDKENRLQSYMPSSLCVACLCLAIARFECECLIRTGSIPLV